MAFSNCPEGLIVDHHSPADSFAQPSSRDVVFATQRASISGVQRD